MLYQLPTEVRDIIYKHLDQPDLLNLLCVSHQFSEVVIPAIWSAVWIDTLDIYGYRKPDSIAKKTLGDCRFEYPVDFIHEKKRRYMLVDRSRFRDFCCGLERGKYDYALSCVKSLTVSIEYTLQESQVGGTLEDCDELGLVHWIIEEIPRYFTGLTQLEILTESVDEAPNPAVTKLDFDNVPTNLYFTVEQSDMPAAGWFKFDNVKVLRLDMTLQGRLSYDLVKHFRAQLPNTVERFEFVNFGDSSVSATGLLKFIANCKSLKSMTLFTPIKVLDDGSNPNSILHLPCLSLMYLSLSCSPILRLIETPNLEKLSIESMAAMALLDLHSDAVKSLVGSFQQLPYLVQLHLENIALRDAALILSYAKHTVRDFFINGTYMRPSEDLKHDMSAFAAQSRSYLEKLLIDAPQAGEKPTVELFQKFLEFDKGHSDDDDEIDKPKLQTLWYSDDKKEPEYIEYAQLMRYPMHISTDFGLFRLSPSNNSNFFNIDLTSIRNI